MDSSNTQFDRAKFDAVWQRVMPEAFENNMLHTAPSKRADDAWQLRAFMDDEAADARIYCLLADKCTGGTRQALLKISSDERCHFKKLRAALFILTGEMYTPPDACPLIYSAPDMLRRKYMGEKDGAAAYRTAAEKTSNKELAEKYLALSEDETQHSRMLGCIIENMM